MRSAVIRGFKSCAASTQTRSYGKGKGGSKGMKGYDDMGYGGKGMKGYDDMGYGKGMKGMDPYGGKGGKGGYDDMGYGGKGMKGMDPYGGKGMKGGYDDMGYGGKGMKGYDDMGYGGKGMKGYDDMGYGGKGMKGGYDDMGYGGKGMKGGYDDMGYGGKGMKGMDPYGGKGGKGGYDDMDYGGKGMKGMDPYGGKGGKGGYDDMDYGGKGMKGMDPYGGKGGKFDMSQGQGERPAPALKPIPPNALKLDFPYPAGNVPELMFFDVRDEICRAAGFIHGQKIRVTNPQNPSEQFDMVVVGAGRDPETGDTCMWFHIAGQPGAGLFHLDLLDQYREHMEIVGKVKLHPLSAQEQEELKAHEKLCRRADLNEMNLQSFTSWQLTLKMQKRWMPKDARKEGPWPPQCNFGYAMDTGNPEMPATYADFDKRSEVVAVFSVGEGEKAVKLQHGFTITVPKSALEHDLESEGITTNKESTESEKEESKTEEQKEPEFKDFVVIGSRPMSGVRYVLWAHGENDPGARPLSIKTLKQSTMKNVAPVAVTSANIQDFKEQEPHMVRMIQVPDH
eukprot:TRINITY_DN667_c0_g1_i3.p1 TRINITY_DN667_c0_g1~~TRINITY_DN667_c0_g1_i3.p1  ORF type:complete len:576 (+),score=126.45 TRINITY_DN667_c0_g1_i3:40-1728(+)